MIGSENIFRNIAEFRVLDIRTSISRDDPVFGLTSMYYGRRIETPDQFRFSRLAASSIIDMDITTQGGNNLLSTTEVAALLRVTAETVVLMAKAGKIDAFKIGRIWRIRLDSLERYIESTATQSQKSS